MKRCFRATFRSALATALLLVVGCAEPAPPPNILWIVWDTVRADRLGVYGARAPTTPHVDRWAAGARVFEDVLAIAPTTVPNHASMFTGRAPSEHRASNAEPRLPDVYPTLAEHLAAAGYGTYLWAANPHIGRGANFTRGFARDEHPWDRIHQKRAIALARAKVGRGDGSGLAKDLDSGKGGGRVSAWAVKESGTLAQSSLLHWLDAQPDARPWFAFMNYMEAHRPVVPARRFREQVMDDAQVAASYALDRGWDTTWRFTFGLAELDGADRAVIAGTYDAAIAELDDLFAQLLGELDARGELGNTVVILTSDHGEHLGEQHMLDHQYSLYDPVLRVPLVVHYPDRFPAGRDARPVMSFDLFPTLLELAGLAEDAPPDSRARSLLAPLAARTRFAEYRIPFAAPFRSLGERNPGFDFSPWKRPLRSLSRDGYKLIWGGDGRHELYSLVDDPGELRDLYGAQRERALTLQRELDALVSELETAAKAPGGPAQPLPPDDRRRLEALGYGTATTGEAR